MSDTSTTTLPEGWELQTLEDAAEVTMGQSPPGTSYNEIGIGAPFFQGKAEFGDLHPTVRKWTTAGKKFATSGDILMSVRAPVGPTNIADIDCVIGRGLAAIRAKAQVNQTYLLWILRSFEHEIASKGTGTTFDSISGDALRSQTIGVPPLAEQEKIVEILEEQLSRLDAALASVRTVREKAIKFRRSLLYAAFSGALTGHDTSPGTLPEGWEEKTLGEVAKWGSGGTPKSGVKKYYGGDIPWTVIGDLTEGLVLETAQTITQEGLDSSSAKIVNPGAVLLAMYGASIGRTGIAGASMATNQAIAFAVPDVQFLDKEFLLKFLQSQKQAFVKAGQGGAQPNISQTVIKVWPVPVPPLAEQEKIVEILEKQLSRLDASLAAAHAVELRAAALRRSLLHAAFTGQITKQWRESNP